MEMNRFPVFSKRFRELRGDKTQAEFADMIGISRPTVGYYENGTRIPDVLTLRQIAERCGVTADYLVGLTNTTRVDVNSRIGLTDKAIQTLEKVSSSFITRIALNAILEDKKILQRLINYLCSFLEDERKVSKFRNIPLRRILSSGYADSNLVRLIEWLPLWKKDTVDRIKADSELLNEMLVKYVANLTDEQLCRQEAERFACEIDFDDLEAGDTTDEEWNAYLDECDVQNLETDEEAENEYMKELEEMHDAVYEVLNELSKRELERVMEQDGNDPETR